jgi:putative transposase
MEPKFSGSQTRFSNWYHIVWIPKYRHSILKGHIRDVCEIVIRDIANQKKLPIQALNIDPDHIHILMAIPPKHRVCEVIQEMKSVTAIILRREFMPEIRRYLWKDGLFWAKGYYCSAVGSLDLKEVEAYIRAHQQAFSQ